MNLIDGDSRFQAFEKLISGMYLGEIARNVLLYLVDLPPVPGTSPPQYYLFGGHSTKQLNTQWGFDTELMSTIEGDRSPAAVRALLVKETGLKPEQISDLDTEVRLQLL